MLNVSVPLCSISTIQDVLYTTKVLVGWTSYDINIDILFREIHVTPGSYELHARSSLNVCITRAALSKMYNTIQLDVLVGIKFSSWVENYHCKTTGKY